MKKSKPESINKCLTDFKKSWSDLDDLINLSSKWEKIVGQDLARESKPLKIENKVLTIEPNHPQWRQELIYYKHKLKISISNYGINLKSIRVVQNYRDSINKEILNSESEWEKHPSRIKDSEIVFCHLCKSPTPIGEIKRWGKCTFCWRKEIAII